MNKGEGFVGGEQNKLNTERHRSLSCKIGKLACFAEKNKKRGSGSCVEKIAITAAVAVISVALLVAVEDANTGTFSRYFYSQQIENSEQNWGYATLDNGEQVKYVDFEYYPVFTREILIEPLKGESELPSEARFLWLPTNGYVDLRSNNAEKISFNELSDVDGYGVIEVCVKDWDDSNEPVKLSAVYDKSFVYDKPRPEAKFAFYDKTSFIKDDYISSYDDYPLGSDEGMDKMREVIEKTESIMDIFSVVNSKTKSSITNKRFDIINNIPNSTPENSKDIQIIKDLEGDCIRRAILTCSLLEKYDENLEPNIVISSTNRLYTHVLVQIKTKDGQYLAIDPDASSQHGYLSAIETQAPYDGMTGYEKILSATGYQGNVKLRLLSSTKLGSYASKINNLSDEIKYPIDI